MIRLDGGEGVTGGVNRYRNSGSSMTAYLSGVFGDIDLRGVAGGVSG